MVQKLDLNLQVLQRSDLKYLINSWMLNVFVTEGGNSGLTCVWKAIFQ